MARVPLAVAAGTLRTVRFPFAFDDPGILTGISVLPASALPAGSLIWFCDSFVTVAFDGTTPTLHFGNLLAGVFTDVCGAGPQSNTNLLSNPQVILAGWAGTANGGVDTGGPQITDGVADLAIAIDGTNGSYVGNDPGCAQGEGIAIFAYSLPELA